MRLLRLQLLVLALSWAASAATPTITGAHVKYKSDRSAAVCWVTDQLTPNTHASLGYDFEGDNIDWVSGVVVDEVGTNNRRCRDLTDLVPSGTLYVTPRSRDNTSNWSVDFTCTGTCTNCGSVDASFFADSSGLDCDGIGEFPNFTMDALVECAGGPPCEPTAPSHSGLTACPAITGSTHTVAAGGGDFDTQLAAAESAASSGGTVEEVIVPAGVAIRSRDQTTPTARFTLDAIANGGWVVIRPDSDPKLLPPAGTMIDPSYFAHMGRFEFNTSMNDNDSGNAILWNASDNSAARGYCFENILMTSPPVGELNVISVAITAINTSTDVLTGDDLTGLQNGMVVYPDLAAAGLTNSNGGAARQICSISGSTFKLSGISVGQTSCGNTLDLQGSSCASDCGSLQHWIAKEIESISNTTPVEVTITGHGLANFKPSTIDGSSAATNVTISDAALFSTGHAVYIDSTGVSTCNGTWIAGTIAGSTVPLTPRLGSVTAADCTGVTSGNIRFLMALSIVGTTDPDVGQYRPVNHAFFVSGANTIVLPNLAAQGTVTGGTLYFDSQTLESWFRLPTSAGQTPMSDIVCDRCAAYLPPWFKQNGVVNAPRIQRFSFVNGWTEAAFWSRINPVSGQEQAIQDLLADDAYRAFVLSMGSDIQLRNNMMLPQPFVFFDTPSTPGSTDITVNQNVQFIPDWAIFSHPDFGGFKHGITFVNEMKDADRFEFVGNYLKGCFSVRDASQVCMNFSGIGRTDTTLGWTRDIRISHNTFDRVGGAVKVASDGAQINMHGPIERILIEHNLAIDVNDSDYDGLASLTAGKFFFQLGNALDVIGRRNTYWPRKVTQPFAWQFGGSRSQGGLFNDNLTLATEGSFDAIGIEQYLAVSSLPTPTQAAGAAAIAEHWKRGTSADPLTDFSSNVWVPGIQNSPSGTYTTKRASVDPTDTVSVDDASGRTALDMTGNVFVGSTTPCSGTCPDSLADRELIALEDGTWVPKAAYSGKGADIPSVEDTQGWVTGISVAGDADSLTISYHAPTTTGCFVQLGRFSTDWAGTFSVANLANITSWTQDASASQAQSVAFTSLPALTKHYYRIACAKSAIGEATTGN